MQITRSNKILLTLGSLGVAATIAGAGTFATFTDTDSRTQAVDAGTVVLNVSGEEEVLNDAIETLAPGDTVERTFTLTNAGSLDFSSVKLSSSDGADAANSHLFEGSPNPGDALQVKLERCVDGLGADVPFTGTPAARTCPETLKTVLAETNASGLSTVTLQNLALSAGSSNSVLATYRLPQSADNAVQGDTGTITYVFDTTQRNATAS